MFADVNESLNTRNTGEKLSAISGFYRATRNCTKSKTA